MKRGVKLTPPPPSEKTTLTKLSLIRVEGAQDMYCNILELYQMNFVYSQKQSSGDVL